MIDADGSGTLKVSELVQGTKGSRIFSVGNLQKRHFFNWLVVWNIFNFSTLGRVPASGGAAQAEPRLTRFYCVVRHVALG